MEFSGVVVSGKGEGSYYVERYNSLFRKKLDYCAKAVEAAIKMCSI